MKLRCLLSVDKFSVDQIVGLRSMNLSLLQLKATFGVIGSIDSY